MTPLPLTATQEEIVEQLNAFKITALNYAVKTISGNDAQYLEPREVKQLTDIVLSLEDSIKSDDTEGKQARTVQRLLALYSSNGDEVVHKRSNVVASDVRRFYKE